MAWQVLHGSANLFSQNPLLDPELSAILPRQGSMVDSARCLQQIGALMSAMTDLKPELEASGVIWPTSLVSQAESLVEIARVVIQTTRTSTFGQP